MKRCPECRKDYVDDSLLYCLDDGTPLVQGVVDEPPTAILHNTGAANEAATRAQIFTTDQTAVLSSGIADLPRAKSFDKRLLLAPLALAVIVLGGFLVYRYVTQAKQIESIAVMPFVNESGNADVEYLSDGMTETLIKSLSQLPNLSVKARSAVFAYKGKQTSPKAIGDELGVQAVLLGRVVQRGDDLKLGLELVDTKTQNVIWSEQYDRKQADLVRLQNEIAQDVSGKLKVKLSGNDAQKLVKVYTNDPEAYRLYLQARFYLNKRVGKLYDRAEGYLMQSIEKDPNFALGYASLAEFISQRDRPRAKEYIARALELDDQLSEAHANLGLQLLLDRQWVASERELKRAIELDPKNPRGYLWEATRSMMIGHYDKCIALSERALALDPTIADFYTNRSACLVAAGKVDAGMAAIKKGMEIDPEFPWSYSQLSFVYRMKGDHAASVEARTRSAELVDRPDLAARLRTTFREKGWNAYLRELLDQTRDLFPSRVRRASILAELGETEEAFASLDEAASEGDWWLFSIKYDPAFDPMRNDRRFQKLVKEFDPPQ